jgi:hypothetical protein
MKGRDSDKTSPPAQTLDSAHRGSGALLDRRRVQLALGALWVFDGLLQAEPVNFARSYPLGELAQSAMGEPRLVNESIFWLIHPFVAQWPLWNAAAVLVQLIIGVGLLWQRNVRPALVLSFGWALLVWWVGEGFGAIPTGFATMLGGAPGPVVLYALLGALAWPHTDRAKLDRSWWTASWVALWVGSAVVQLMSPLPSSFLLQANLEEVAAGQRSFLHAASYWLYDVATRSGTAVDVALVVVELSVGFGVLLPRLRSPALGLALAFAGFAWVVGQDMGGILSAGATDPGSGPLLALLALAGWRGSESNQFDGAECALGQGQGFRRLVESPAVPGT